MVVQDVTKLSDDEAPETPPPTRSLNTPPATVEPGSSKTPPTKKPSAPKPKGKKKKDAKKKSEKSEAESKTKSPEQPKTESKKPGPKAKAGLKRPAASMQMKKPAASASSKGGLTYHPDGRIRVQAGTYKDGKVGMKMGGKQVMIATLLKQVFNNFLSVLCQFGLLTCWHAGLLKRNIL